MSLFGTPKIRSGNLGGPDSVVIRGTGESTILSYRDPNLRIEIEISDSIKDLAEGGAEAAIKTGDLKIATDSNDPEAIKNAIEAIKAVAGLNPTTSWFVTSAWGIESAFDVALDRAISTLRNRNKQIDAAVDGALGIDNAVKTNVDRGNNWTQPRDPLILDLDVDGIELTSSSSSTLFDHNADGINTGTQWVKSDDGLLVRDLNGNGTIDSGRELFGDNTRLANGQLATNGFQALADLDSNLDAVFDANDAAYSELRVWRDLNQDGISQANELQTLADAGITSINLNANAQGASTFTKDGATQAVQNVNFATNNFYSEFTDNPVITASAADLPQMQGAGFVRDMCEAMSLGNSAAQTRQQTLTSFKAATTAQERQALLDQVITAWANTSSLKDAKARSLALAGPLAASGSRWYVGSPTQAIAEFAQSQPALYAQLSALERFNGQSVIERYTRATNASYYSSSTLPARKSMISLETWSKA